MLSKDSQAIIKQHADAINTFVAYVDFNISSLIDFIDKIMAEEEEVNPCSRPALGVIVTHIGELAEQNYGAFCATFSEKIMIAEQYVLSHMGNELIKDNIEDTLSEIVNVLQVIAVSFIEEVEEHSPNPAELQGLHTILRFIKSAATLCVQVILDVQASNDSKVTIN